MNEIKKSSLIQADDGQTIKIPAGFELPGKEVTVTKDGDRLIIEPANLKPGSPASWAELLDSWDDLDVDWPDVDEGLLPPDDIII